MPQSLGVLSSKHVATFFYDSTSPSGLNLIQRLMRLAPPVPSCPIILIILILLILVQILIRLKPVAWSQQTSTRQDIRLILLTTVMFPAPHIISRHLPWNLRQSSKHIVSRHHSHSSISYDSRNNNGLPYYAGHSSTQLHHYPTSSRSNSYQTDQRSVQLFDPENPQRPHPNLMTHFINVFFERHEFPFLSYQDVSTDFWDQRLSSILANCIAAMASQYVTRYCSNNRHLTKEKECPIFPSYRCEGYTMFQKVTLT